MTNKALISEYTWRSLEIQKAKFPDMAYFLLPDDLNSLFRSTQRKERLTIYVMSFGVVARDKKSLREFAKLCRKRNAEIWSNDEAFTWMPNNSYLTLEEKWLTARKNGSGKIGGQISANRKKAKVKEAAMKIADRWPLPSKEHPTRDLLKEADVSLNAIKSVLGKRPIAQYNYQAAQKRRERRNAKR